MIRLRFTGKCTFWSPVLIVRLSSSRSLRSLSHSSSSRARFSAELARSFTCASDIHPRPKPGSSGSM